VIRVTLQLVDPRRVDWVVDSGVLVARFLSDEPLHMEAKAFMVRIARKGEVLEIPEAVISEVLHVLLAKHRWGERRTDRFLDERREAARRFLAWLFNRDPRQISIPRDLDRPDYWSRVADLAGGRRRRKSMGGNDASVVALVNDRPRARLCTTESALLDACPGFHVKDAAAAP
jgi:predicted nucleic acid-binding protein